MALASEAVLTALDYYIRTGGGSRGARAICDPVGACLPMAATVPLAQFRFRQERAQDKDGQIIVRLDAGKMVLTNRPNRTRDGHHKSFFERDWPKWLMGGIFQTKTTGPDE
jgi:hypothetical protein